MSKPSKPRKLDAAEFNRVDAYIGSRIRLRRLLLGMSVVELAQALGLEPETVERFESGDTRVGAPQLAQLSQIMGISISWFFDGMSVDAEYRFGGALPSAEDITTAMITKEETELLMANFGMLAQRRNRQLVNELARRLVDLESPVTKNSKLN